VIRRSLLKHAAFARIAMAHARRERGELYGRALFFVRYSSGSRFSVFG
jgi:hypothetical protein